MNGQVRPRRAGRERSKNGCRTCKIRRVKCDETTPSCRRCTESGRKCEGPVVRKFHFIQDQPITRSITSIPQLEISFLAPQRSDDERRAFHFFTHHPSPLHAGTVDARFWESLVPQLAQTYDFVWDIVVCLGSLLENVSYASLDPTGQSKITNHAHRHALKFYNRAITNLRQLAERDKIDGSVVVLSYILFASVESQQRNSRTGGDLIKRCARLLTEDLASLKIRHESAAGQAIHQVVAPFVLRRAVLVSTLGNPLKPQWIENDRGHRTFSTTLSQAPGINEALVHFNSMMFQCFELIRLADFIPNIKDDDPDKIMLFAQQESLLNDLVQWKRCFTAISCRKTDPEIRWILSYVIMYWEVCYTTLATCTSLHQTIFDSYLDHFAEIIKHATVCLKLGHRDSKIGSLSSSHDGLIPPLYFCATKCRDPSLRREALHLMRQTPPRNNLWAFVASDRVVAKIIELEEGEGQFASPESSPKSFCATVPPENQRFAYVTVVNRQVPGGRPRQALELNRFEFSRDGSRTLVYDYAWLDNEDEV